MTAYATRAKPKRSALVIEEELAWVSFYRRARKYPAVAAEVLAQLDADPEMKREHLALYLCCRESLRLQQARALRHQRIGRFVRWLCGKLFVGAPKATGRALEEVRDLAIACLPDSGAEPAAAQVQRLTKDPKVRASRAAYKASPATGTPAAQEGSDATPRSAQASG